jgi:ATP synthase subunit 6
MLSSPLETFEVVLYYPLFPLLDLSFTNASLYLLLLFFLLVLLLIPSTTRTFLVPSRSQLLLESLYSFILTMVKEQTGRSAIGYFPLFLLVFLFIAVSNLVGLIPFAFTVTAQFAVTFALALSFNLGFLFLGFARNGLNFLRLFVPSDAPPLLLPLIVVIEVVSYLIRTFSLSIRLFANMMAGHTLLHILTTFALKMLKSGGLFLLLAFLPFVLVLAVFALEFAIALIQAYVFVILLCIYVNDSYHPGH